MEKNEPFVKAKKRAAGGVGALAVAALLGLDRQVALDVEVANDDAVSEANFPR